MTEMNQRPMRAKLTGATAQCEFRCREDFTRLRRMLEINTHFNGAAEMLERVEAALRLTKFVELPVPKMLCQNGNMTLSLIYEGFSMLLSTDAIIWRFASAGEPHAVTDAATKGVPVDVLNALAHLSRLAVAN